MTKDQERLAAAVRSNIAIANLEIKVKRLREVLKRVKSMLTGSYLGPAISLIDEALNGDE